MARKKGEVNQIDSSPNREQIRQRLASKLGSRRRGGIKETYSQISEWIREEFGEEISTGMLRYYVEHYIKPGRELPAEACSAFLSKREELLDTVSERARLIKLQWARVKAGVQRDGRNPQGGTREDIRVLNELFRDYDKGCVELGIRERVPERRELHVTGLVAAVELARERAREGGLLEVEEAVVDGECRELPDEGERANEADAESVGVVVEESGCADGG